MLGRSWCSVAVMGAAIASAGCSDPETFEPAAAPSDQEPIPTADDPADALPVPETVPEDSARIVAVIEPSEGGSVRPVALAATPKGPVLAVSHTRESEESIERWTNVVAFDREGQLRFELDRSDAPQPYGGRTHLAGLSDGRVLVASEHFGADDVDDLVLLTADGGETWTHQFGQHRGVDGLVVMPDESAVITFGYDTEDDTEHLTTITLDGTVLRDSKTAFDITAVAVTPDGGRIVLGTEESGPRLYLLGDDDLPKGSYPMGRHIPFDVMLAGGRVTTIGMVGQPCHPEEHDLLVSFGDGTDQHVQYDAGQTIDFFKGAVPAADGRVALVSVSGLLGEANGFDVHFVGIDPEAGVLWDVGSPAPVDPNASFSTVGPVLDVHGTAWVAVPSATPDSEVRWVSLVAFESADLAAP